VVSQGGVDQLELKLLGIPGQWYALARTVDLTSPAREEVTRQQADATGNVVFNAPITVPGQAFYRAGLVTP
jgi:hypothetical protein